MKIKYHIFSHLGDMKAKMRHIWERGYNLITFGHFVLFLFCTYFFGLRVKIKNISLFNYDVHEVFRKLI